MGKDSVAVRIAGHEYKIRSDGDADSLREIASYVDRSMSRVRERTGTVDSLDVAVLTCLNLAREILALHGQQTPSGAVAIDEGQLRGLIERVESSLVGARSSSASGADDSVERGRESGVGHDAVRAGNDREQAGAKTPDADRSRVEGPSKTLELPSVECLRERTPSTGQVDALESSAAPEPPEARVAAGGRDRVS